eukprot:750739-Hanusia_phi.AAC.1
MSVILCHGVRVESRARRGNSTSMRRPASPVLSPALTVVGVHAATEGTRGRGRPTESHVAFLLRG